MAILGRGRPNNAKIIWAGTFAIPEVTGDSAQTLDDFTLSTAGIVGAEEVASYSGGGGPPRQRARFAPQTPKKPKQPIVVVIPKTVHGNARATVDPVSTVATAFFDLRALIDSENEILLLI